MAAPTTGPAWPSTRPVDWCSSRPVRRRPTSTAPTAPATTCSPTACWRSTPPPGGSVWHFQAVHHDIWDRDFPPRRRWSPCGATAGRSTRWRRPPSRASSSSSIARPARPLFPVDEQPVPASTVPGERAVAHPAGAAPARAVRTAAADRRSADPSHAGGARLGRRRVRQAAHRGVVHAAARRPGHRRLSRLRRRRGVGRQRLRPGLGAAVRQRQRPGVDRRAGPRRRRHRRPRALPEIVRELPPRRSPRRAAADSGAHQPHRVRRAVDHGDPPGRGPHARVPQSLAGGRPHPGRLPARHPRPRRGASRGAAAGSGSALAAAALHRLQEVPRSRRLPRRGAAVGHAERHRPEHRRLRVEDSAGRVSGAGGAGPERHRLGELRRADRHRRRRAVHRRHQLRPQVPRLRRRAPDGCCGR